MLYDRDIFRLFEDSVITYSTKGKIGLIDDMNSRTSVSDDFIVDDNFHPSLQDQIRGIFSYTSDCNLSTRVNPDNVRNEYGSQLLKMCKSTGLRILNGRHGWIYE